MAHLKEGHKGPDWLDATSRNDEPLGAHGTITVKASFAGNMREHILRHLAREFGTHRHVVWAGDVRFQESTLPNGDREIVFEVSPRWVQDLI